MKTIIFLSLLFLSIQTYATHLLGGYIQAKPASPGSLRYEVIVTLYLDQVNGLAASAGTTSLSICFGDGSTALAPRSSQQLFSDRTVSLTTFSTEHTFPSTGTYTMTAALQTRSPVRNLSQDVVGQPLTLNTSFVINSQFPNQTPILSVPGTGFRFGVNRRTALNLLATDADGDSLIYSLARPLTSNLPDQCSHTPVPSFQFPNDIARKGTFKVDSRTGILIWDVPTELGQYTVAVLVEERRNGVTLSQTLHEFPIFVVDLPGNPDPLPPYEPAGGSITGLPELTDTNVQVTVLPNPVDDRLRVVIQTAKSATAMIQLRDVNGRLIRELRFAQPAQRHEQLMDLESLSAGVYLVRADVDGRTVTQKIVKK